MSHNIEPYAVDCRDIDRVIEIKVWGLYVREFLPRESIESDNLGREYPRVDCEEVIIIHPSHWEHTRPDYIPPNGEEVVTEIPVQSQHCSNLSLLYLQ